MTNDRGVGLKGWLTGPRTKQSETKPIPESPTSLDKRRIAVLPFVSMSADPQDEFFADGLTEELIDRLCQAQELEVIARTSVMVFKKKEKKAADIGRELMAGALVEGSVRKAGNKIRVTAQLIDANTEAHLWSSRYDRDLEDIFAVQSSIARQVAEALTVKLLPDERKAIEKKATGSMQAYTLYLKGRYYWNERTENSVKRGIEYLKLALEEDPNFANAYSDLADCYVIMADYGMIEGKEAYSLVSKYAGAALERDAKLSQPHAALGITFERNFKWADSELEFQRAIELNPNNSTAHHWYALNVWFRNRVEQAIREWRRAKDLDPLSLIISCALGTALAFARQEQEGFDMLKQAIEINDRFPVLHRNIAFCYIKSGRMLEAATEADRLVALDAGLGYNAHAAWVYAKAGRKKDALQILDQLVTKMNQHYVDPAIIAMIYASLGDETRTFEWLETAVAKRSSGLAYVNMLPAFDAMRDNPRFKGMMQSVGLQ